MGGIPLREITVKKRTVVRIVCYCLALAAVLGGAALLHLRVGQTYKLLLESGYRRALSDVTRSLDELEEGLHAGMVMRSPEQVSGAALQLLSASTAGKAALESLPLQEDGLAAIQLYLAQIGDYAAALQREAILDKSLSAECRDNLSKLLEFNTSLRDMMARVEQLASEGGALMPSVDAEILTRYADTGGDLPIVTALMAEEQLSEYPTLLYDGRYSVHRLEPAAYAYAFEGEEITLQEAVEVAAEFLGISPGELEPGGETSGDVPSYLLSHKEVAVEISKLGGRVVTMLNGRQLGEARLPMEDAFGVAEAFLLESGYESMAQVGYQVAANQVVLEYVYESGEVLYYPDSVSITVALDEGDVVGFSAEKFLRSHTGRDNGGAKPRLTPSGAEQYLPEGHTFGGARYAVVASPGGLESHALELTTTLDDHTYLYYLDAMSGLEMKLSRLIENSGGKRIQ